MSENRALKIRAVARMILRQAGQKLEDAPPDEQAAAYRFAAPLVDACEAVDAKLEKDA